jgi:hypothetical protein
MKTANSYGSLLRGVSQQVPQDRADGQHGEQVNMLSDPVNGLTRRHGSHWLAEKLLSPQTVGEIDSYIADTAGWLSYEFDNAGSQYVILIRTASRPATTNPLPVLIAYNRTTNTFLNIVRNVADSALDLLESGGASAFTAIGRYLFLAGHSVNFSGSSVNTWADATNSAKAVVWIRGGAYSRTYSMTLTRTDGYTATYSYTTPSSSYQGTLDTSDILTSDPDYTKKLNDRVNAYNAAVTSWIGTSSAAVQPAAIAAQLLSLCSGAFTTTLVGSHLTFTNCTGATVNDGGDGSFIRGVANEIESIDKVSVIHHIGKVVRVRSRSSAESYYLKAMAKVSGATGIGEVTWTESAGVTHSITGGLFYATVSGSNIYMAGSATLLSAIIAGTHPTFSPSDAGDDDSAPAPFFVGRKVTYLGSFQNRLLIGSGGVLAVSKAEDYLNFFRSTVLSLPADEPFEMLPQGSEDDELRYSTLYNQSLVIFGKKRQYVVNGKVPLTPTSANMAVMSNYAGVADAPPVATGGFIFYSKRGEKYSSLHQIQPGLTENSPESFPASSQIDSYIRGGSIELVSATGSPSHVLMRANGARSSVYVFTYLDKQDGRKLDAWSRWDFDAALGAIIGIRSVVDAALVFHIRAGAGGVYVVADSIPLVTGLSDTPYLDSQRPWSQVLAGTGSVIPASTGNWAAAFDTTSSRRFTGTALANVATLQANYPSESGLTVGAVQDAYFEPTNPYMRDGKGKAILSGRLAIAKLVIGFKDSIGFKWQITYRNTVVTSIEFNGRIMGTPENIIGVEPITTGQYNLPIGRETRSYTLRISARKWYPFTAAAIEWSGQFFNRVQRF